MRDSPTKVERAAVLQHEVRLTRRARVVQDRIDHLAQLHANGVAIGHELCLADVRRKRARPHARVLQHEANQLGKARAHRKVFSLDELPHGHLANEPATEAHLGAHVVVRLLNGGRDVGLQVQHVRVARLRHARVRGGPGPVVSHERVVRELVVELLADGLQHLHDVAHGHGLSRAAVQPLHFGGRLEEAVAELPRGDPIHAVAHVRREHDELAVCALVALVPVASVAAVAHVQLQLRRAEGRRHHRLHQPRLKPRDAFGHCLLARRGLLCGRLQVVVLPRHRRVRGLADRPRHRAHKAVEPIAADRHLPQRVGPHGGASLLGRVLDVDGLSKGRRLGRVLLVEPVQVVLVAPHLFHLLERRDAREQRRRDGLWRKASRHVQCPRLAVARHRVHSRLRLRDRAGAGRSQIKRPVVLARAACSLLQMHIRGRS